MSSYTIKLNNANSAERERKDQMKKLYKNMDYSAISETFLLLKKKIYIHLEILMIFCYQYIIK